MLEPLLFGVAGWAVATGGYLLTLSAAGAIAGPRTPPPRTPRHRLAVLIPAHDEEALVGQLVASVRAQDYPAALLRIFVVADNCTDGTADRAREGGAEVYERVEPDQRGKPLALRWLLERVRESGWEPEAYVVLDADSVISEGFLRAMDTRLSAGQVAMQAYYSVLNPAESPVSALRYAAFASLHYVRPLGRAALGLSCGLKGNGMCFAASMLERGWSWLTLAEDVEAHLALVADGIVVDFAPEAQVLAVMPTSLRQAAGQNARWEQGRLAMLRRRVPGLLLDAVRRRSAVRADAAIEQLIPPLSVAIAVSLLPFGAGLIAGNALLASIAGVGVASFLLHVFTGLVMVRAPMRAYLALLYTPVYIPWKLGLYVRALVARTEAWTRTSRVATPASVPAVPPK